MAKHRLRRRRLTPACGKTQSLHCLPSDPNISKEWINLLLNEVPEHISKNLFLCSLHFTVDLLTNKADWNLKMMLCWLYWKKSVTFFNYVPVITVWYVLSIYAFLTKIIVASIYEGLLLTNHSSEHLLPSLHSATPIQTERSDEGVKTGQKIAYYF